MQNLIQTVNLTKVQYQDLYVEPHFNEIQINTKIVEAPLISQKVIKAPIQMIVKKTVQLSFTILQEKSMEIPTLKVKIIEVPIVQQKAVNVPVNIDNNVNNIKDQQFSVTKNLQPNPQFDEITQKGLKDLLDSQKDLSNLQQKQLALYKKITNDESHIFQVPLEIEPEKKLIIKKIMEKLIEVPVQIILEVQKIIQVFRYVYLRETIKSSEFYSDSQVKIIAQNCFNESLRSIQNDIKSLRFESLQANHSQNVLQQRLKDKQQNCFFLKNPIFTQSQQIPSQTQLNLKYNKNLIRENQNSFQLSLSEIASQTDAKRHLAGIVAMESESIIHEIQDQDIQIQQSVHNTVSPQLEEKSASIYKVNLLLIGRDNLEQSIEYDDESQQIKSLNVSVIGKQQNQQNNMFGSINVVIGKHENLLNPRLQLDLRNNSSFDCGDHTGKEMKIDDSNCLNPNKNNNCKNGMPILLQNTDQISQTQNNYSNFREKIIICQEHLQEIEKLRSEICFVQADNETNKIENLRLSEKNKSLQIDVQQQKTEIMNLTQKLETLVNQRNAQILEFHFQRDTSDGLIDKLKEEKQEINKNLGQISLKYQRLQDMYEKIKSNYQQLSSKYIEDEQKLRNQLHEKQAQIQAVKQEEKQLRSYYETQLSQINGDIKNAQVVIEKLEEEILRKEDLIQKLNHSHQELRQKLCSIFSGHPFPQHATADLYEQEFLRIKDKFEQQVQDKSHKNIELTLIIQNLEDKVEKEQQNYKILKQKLAQTQSNKKQLSVDDNKLKIQNQLKLQQLESQLNRLKEENSQLRDYNNKKTLVIEILTKELSNQIHLDQTNLSNESSKEEGSLTIQHEDNQLQILKLQSVIMNYQKIIETHESAINQLKEKAYEYFKNSLDKERQTENLYTKLQDHENNINNLILEKNNLQIENKGLKIAINQSEKKLDAFSTQLIRFLKESVHY